MPRKSIRYGNSYLKDDSGNLKYGVKKILDDLNARLSDIQDINLPTDISSEDNNKILGAVYEDAISYGDGSSGDVTISTETQINQYTDLIEDHGLGDTVLAVRNATPFIGKKEILIHQTQNYRWHNNTADITTNRMVYEIKQIESVDTLANTINITTGLSRQYKSDSDGDKTHNTKTQIISIPNYNSLTVNANIIPKSWDGYSGGIVIFRSKLLSGNSSIYTTGLGFRQAFADYARGEGWDGLGVGDENRGGGRGTSDGGYDYASGGHNGIGGETPDGNITIDQGGTTYGLQDGSYLNQYFTLGGGGWSDGIARASGSILAYVQSFSSWTGSFHTKGQGSGGSGAGGSVLLYTPSQYVGVYDVSGADIGVSPVGGYYYNTIPTNIPTKEYRFVSKISNDFSTALSTHILTKAAIEEAISSIPGGSGGLGINDRVIEIHQVDNIEESAGFITLAHTVKYPDKLLVVASGLQQRNYDAVGTFTPDFRVINNNQIHFNTNGGTPGLSGDISNSDELIVIYEY